MERVTAVTKGRASGKIFKLVLFVVFRLKCQILPLGDTLDSSATPIESVNQGWAINI